MAIFNSYVKLPEGIYWLLVSNMNGLFSISLGWDVIRNPLTNSIIFQDGQNHQPVIVISHQMDFSHENLRAFPIFPIYPIINPYDNGKIALLSNN